MFDRSSLNSPHGFIAGKPGNHSQEQTSVCFRCFRPGHFVRDCRAVSFGQSGKAKGDQVNNNRPSELERCISLHSNESVEVLNDDDVQRSCFVIFENTDCHSAATVKGRLKENK